MTAVSPRIPRLRVRERQWFAGNPFKRLTDGIVNRLAGQAALPRPPAYIVLCATVGVLNIVGLVMILSASSVAALANYGSSWFFFQRQFLWALGGLVMFIIASRVDYRFWQKLAPIVLVVTTILLVVVLMPSVGKHVDGGRRWIEFGPIQIQPSELAKIAILLCGSMILARRADRIADPRSWRPVLVVGGLLAGLVMLEKDLTSTVVVGSITITLLLVGGVSRKHMAQLFAAGFGIVVFLALTAGYRRQRMFTFLNPSHDIDGAGYQLWRSLIAVGSGGFDGVGLGAGRAKWFFLPNAHTDFIFAIVGEELGFVGSVLVLGLFAGLGVVGFRIARHAPDRFGMLVATGVTAWVVGQAAINIGAVVGVLPVSGVPLPFLSVGGTSLVITMFAVGMLANIARHTVVPSSPSKSASDRKAPLSGLSKRFAARRQSAS
jgi:cell division protein FtsW